MGIYTAPIANKLERGDGTWYCPLCSSVFRGEPAFDLHQEYKDPLRWNPPTKGWLCHGAKYREAHGLVRERDVWHIKEQANDQSVD